MSTSEKQIVQYNVKAISCRQCKGKGKIRVYISPPDLRDDGWTTENKWVEFLKNLKNKTTQEECRVCNGTGFEDHKKVEFESIKHETEKAILVIINNKEIWVAKSIIAQRNEKSLVVPQWTQLLTQEEWYHRRTHARFMAEDNDHEYWDSFGYDPADFF